MDITVKIIPNESGQPKDKVADAEIVFGADAGALAGLRLVGFSVWTRRGGGHTMTVPARTYSVNGERRSYGLIRTVGDSDPNSSAAMSALRTAIIDAYIVDETGIATKTHRPADRAQQAAAPGIDIDTITDYGVTARLQNAVRMF